ncbi:MAG: hypothetical protein IJ644_11685 [Oscillospiraceae bacterium]|nr:hypothetical protein [Oscillospiraceae bacterium]
MPELKQIFSTLPNPENQYVTYQDFRNPRRNFHHPDAEQLFETHQEEIMQIVRKELSDYLNDEDLCNDEEDMFPRRCFLTGEWYVSELSSFDNEPDVFFSVQTAFLGTDLGCPDDYLGLEVLLYYDENTGRFESDGINSEAL